MLNVLFASVGARTLGRLVDLYKEPLEGGCCCGSATGRTIWGSIPGGGRKVFFFILQNFLIGSGAHPASCTSFRRRVSGR
jgi:hypothetical protein